MNQVPHSQVIKMHLRVIQMYYNVNILDKYYRLYNAIVSVIVSTFWEREIHRRRKWAVTPKYIYYMVFQSKMESKSELASFLTSEAECEKITYVAKHFYALKIIFAIHSGYSDHFEWLYNQYCQETNQKFEKPVIIFLNLFLLQ